MFTVILAPKRKSSDAGSDYKPTRSRDVLPISEKVKIVDIIEIIKNCCAEITRLYGKNESSIHEVMVGGERERERERERNLVSFSVAPQTAKVAAIARAKMLMKEEKALNVWVEDTNRKRLPLFITLH